MGRNRLPKPRMSLLHFSAVIKVNLPSNFLAKLIWIALFQKVFTFDKLDGTKKLLFLFDKCREYIFFFQANKF